MLTLDDCSTISESLRFSLDKLRNHDYLQDQPTTDETRQFYEGIRKDALHRLSTAKQHIDALRRQLKAGDAACR